MVTILPKIILLTCDLAYGTDAANQTNIVCTTTYISGGLYQASYDMTLTGEFTLITTVAYNSQAYVNEAVFVVTASPYAGNKKTKMIILRRGKIDTFGHTPIVDNIIITPTIFSAFFKFFPLGSQ